MSDADMCLLDQESVVMEPKSSSLCLQNPAFGAFLSLCVCMCVYVCMYTRGNKIGSLVFSNNTPSGTVFIRILLYFVALYLLFLPSHRYRTKQNRSCQLLLIVRMQYGCFTQCQKRIKSLISFKVIVLLAGLYLEYKLIFDVVK
jgi:hypothetical protein